MKWLVWLLSLIVVIVAGCDPGAVSMVFIRPVDSSSLNNKIPLPPDEIEQIRNVVESVGSKYGFEPQPDEYSIVHLSFPRQDINDFTLRCYFDPKENRTVVDILEFPCAEQSRLALTIHNEIAEQLRTRLGPERIGVELSPAYGPAKWPGLANLGQGDILREGFAGQSKSKKQLLSQYNRPDFVQEPSGELIRIQRPYNSMKDSGLNMIRGTFFYIVYNRAVEIRDDCVVAVNPMSDEQWEMIFRYFKNNRKSLP